MSTQHLTILAAFGIVALFAVIFGVAVCWTPASRRYSLPRRTDRAGKSEQPIPDELLQAYGLKPGYRVDPNSRTGQLLKAYGLDGDDQR